MLQALLATQVYYPHGYPFFPFLSFFVCWFVWFLFPERVKMLHTSLATQDYFSHGYLRPLYALLPHRSICYSKVPRSKYCMPFFPEKMKMLHTCHLPHSTIFHISLFLSQVYLPQGTIVCIVTIQVYYLFHETKVKILHASFATQDYLPHRFIAFFKVTQVLTRCRDNRLNKMVRSNL